MPNGQMKHTRDSPQMTSADVVCAGQERSLRTQIEVDAAKAFLQYEHRGQDPADVTFNLKDFKAMLALCEALGTNVSISFEGPASPVVVKPHWKPGQVHERLSEHAGAAPGWTDQPCSWCWLEAVLRCAALHCRSPALQPPLGLSTLLRSSLCAAYSK